MRAECYRFEEYHYEIVISVSPSDIYQFWNRTFNRILFSEVGKFFSK